VADRLAVLEHQPDPAAMPAPPDALVWQAIPAALQPLNTWANRPDCARAVIPAGNAVANARALARVYAALVGDGVDGVRLLSPERVRIASQMQTDAMDVVIEQSWPKGMGYFLGSASATATCISPTAFGHSGAGGFTAYADPPHELAFALCKTRMVDTSDPDMMTARLFERELHRALAIQ
jgi:CubicO group peptidase (beta-lactamase class C family)